MPEENFLRASFQALPKIPIFKIDELTNPSLGAVEHGQRFPQDKLMIVLTSGDGRMMAIEGTHDAIQELNGKIGLVTAEYRETYLMDLVKKGRERIHGVDL